MATNSQTQAKAVDWSQFTPVAQAPVDWSQYTPVAEQAGPWQKYAAQQQAQADPQGPWTKYQRQPTAQARNGDVNPYAQFVQDEPNPYAQFVQRQASPEVQRVSDLYREAVAAGNGIAAQHFAGWLQAHGGATPASAGGNAAVQSIAQDVAAAHPQSGNQVEDAAIAFLHHFNNPTVGAVQGLVHGAAYLGDKLAGKPAPTLAQLVTGAQPQRSGVAGALDAARNAVDQYAQKREADYQAFVPNGIGTTIGAGAGMVAPWLLGSQYLKGAAAIPKAATFMGRLGAAGAGGALMGATTPVTSGNFTDTKLGQVGMGAATGAAAQLAPEVLGGIGSRLAPVMGQAKQDALATAARYNIPLHLTQVANGRFTQALGAATRFLPFSGAGAADNAQRIAWNRALASTMGEDATELTPDVVANAKRVAGNDYTRVLGPNSIDMDGPTMNALASAQAKAHAELLPGNAALVDQQIDRVINAAADNGGAIPGAQYQDLRNSLKDSVRANPTLTHHLGAVRSALEDAANRQIPDLAPINARYKNIKTIEQGLKQTGGANNTITPPNLYRLTQGRYGATPQMQALAQLGQTVLKSPINDSGTAQRWLAYRMLGAGGLGAAGYLDPKDRQYLMPLAGALVAGPTLGRFMNSNTAARAMPYLGSSLFNGAATLARPLPLLLPSLQNNP